MATFLQAFMATIIGGVTVMVLMFKEVDRLHTDAIAHGYAQYCPDTGAWAWKGECK